MAGEPRALHSLAIESRAGEIARPAAACHAPGQDSPPTDAVWGQRNGMEHGKDSLAAILVIYKTMTSFAKKFLVAEQQKRNQGVGGESVPHMRLDISVFFEPELVVNVTQHETVPKHRLLAPKEKKKLLERFKVSEEQLPRIPITDPVAKYLGLRRGDVVEIERESDTAGRYITYRTCL